MNTWNLVETETHPKNGQPIYLYTSMENRQLAFYLHPTKAFSAVFTQYHGISEKQARYVFDKWMENAIGPAAEFSERIKKFVA